MKQAYLIKQGVEEFALAREQFAVIVAQLQSAVVLGMEHGEVEKLVSREGTELLRRLVQAHFDLRTGREKRETGVRGADGVPAKPGTTRMPKAAGEFVRAVEVSDVGTVPLRKGACSRSIWSSICPKTATRTGCGNGWPRRWRAARSMRRCAPLRRRLGSRSPSVSRGGGGPR